MFAVVRTGGKQYRVAAGDKIAVEKLAGEAGDTVTLGDVLLAGEGDNLAEAGKVQVSAEIIAQAKSEKVTVFKKRRRLQLPPQGRSSPADDAAADRPGRRFEGRRRAAAKAEAKSDDAPVATQG